MTPSVAWKTLTLSKNEGGLGLKQMKAWNMAPLTKLIWGICNKSTDLWTSWASRVVLHGGNFWRAKIPQECSWTWWKVLKLRSRVDSFVYIELGDGRQTSLIYDNWFHKQSLASLLKDDNEVGVWGHDDMVSQWCRDSRWSIPETFKRRHPDLAGQIEEIQLSNVVDHAIWDIHGSGKFSLTSCYEGLRVKKQLVPWNNIVWSSCIFPRHSFILWVLAHGKLKTKDRLQRLGTVVDQLCVLCSREDETINHLFFDCTYTTKVWSEILEKIGVQHRPLIWHNEWEWMMKHVKGRSKEKQKLKITFAAAVYFV